MDTPNLPRTDRGRISRRAAVGATLAGALSLPHAGRLLAAQSTPEADGSDLRVPLYPHGQPISLDPHRATNWGPHWVMLPNVWAGLLGFDENGKVVPVLASTIEPEGDGATWVATIASGATFASGNPVTAQALIDGWKRALDPVRLAPMATYMHRVKGYDAYVTGEATEIGFEARDDTTVTITLAEPYAFFPEDLATFVWAAVDMAALDGLSDAEAPFAGASAGPWQFEASDDPATIRMTPSPSGGGHMAVDAVLWTLQDGPQAAGAALDAFRQGALPLADVPTPLRADVTSDLQTVPLSGSTMMIGMDYSQAPFDNPAVRKAVAAAVDRDAWATEIMGGAFTPAGSLTPPVLTHTANYAPPELLPFDPGAARALVADAGIDADSMPQVTYYQPAGSAQWEIDQAAALLQMIQDNAGLVIEHDTTLTAEQIEALRGDNGGLQFDIRWWWPLTNSPSGLADIGLPDAPAMAGWFNWSPEVEDEDAAQAAEEFTTLVHDALVSLDATDRQQKLAQAEALLVQQAVYVPLGHWTQAWVQAPGLTGTRQGAFTGYVPVAFDESVSWQPDDGTPTGS
jgi:oligopeptide transport system substrate-binding protein